MLGHLCEALRGNMQEMKMYLNCSFGEVYSRVYGGIIKRKFSFTLISGSVVECLTRDRGAMGSSLTSVTALWSLSKTRLS